jgi:NADH dehydrogenase
VRRLIHVSALGVTDEPGAPLASQYLRSKADGERVLRQTAGLDLTIFRPSVVFGPDDRFLNLFAALQRLSPVMPLARAGARLQPVFVGDVAAAIVKALDAHDTLGQAYELVGPDVFTLRELVQIAGRLSGHARPVVALPDWLGWLQAAALEFAPGPTLMSRDNFASLSVDNVATPGARQWPQELGMHPTPLMAVLPGWLGAGQRPSSRMRARHG